MVEQSPSEPHQDSINLGMEASKLRGGAYVREGEGLTKRQRKNKKKMEKKRKLEKGQVASEGW